VELLVQELVEQIYIMLPEHAISLMQIHHKLILIVELQLLEVQLLLLH
jgi:hypothetical protein